MRKTLLITVLSLSLFACSKKENSASIDDLIKSKNIKELQLKKVSIQADLAKIDEALALLDLKKR